MYMGEGAEACVSEWGECPVCRSGPVPVPARAAGAGVAVGTRISRLKGARKVQRHWPRTGIQLPGGCAQLRRRVALPASPT